MSKTLYILRGVSGCGKTTLSNTLRKQLHIDDEDALTSCYTVSADDYHYDNDGNYYWLSKNVPVAHKWCQDMVDDYMELSIDNIIVHNTNTTEKEIKPYIDLADKYGYKVVSLVVENRHGNDSVHNVPKEVRDKQEKRLRSSLKLK